MENEDIGTPIFVGTDEYGSDIYIMGMRNVRQIVIPSIKSLLNENSIASDHILFVNALVKLHPITAIGGMLSRRLGLIAIGKPLTIWGIRRHYKVFVELVEKVKEKQYKILCSCANSS